MRKTIIFTFLVLWLTACDGGKSVNSTNAVANDAQANKANANSVVTNKEAANSNNSVLSEATLDAEKIKPDENAKLENGKDFSAPLFDVTLPDDWKYQKTSYGEEFRPAKPLPDGLTGFYFIKGFANKESRPHKDKKAMLESDLQAIIKDKREGRADYVGTYGFAVGNNLVAGAVKVADKIEAGVDPKTKCSMETLHGCGRYSWAGYVGGENAVTYYFAVMFPPGTYEKNKPTIDAIVRSVRFR